jgi:protein-L-isoaspartate(D-aspartate) O-methyltransferase
MNSYKDLITSLLNIGAIRSKNVLEAFRKVDRVKFVLDSEVYNVYEDYPLQIGCGQTISQPRTVAMMLEMLEAQEGEQILDLGSGSGWTTALLACIVKEKGYVTGVERIPSLVEFGNKNLKKLALKNAKIIQASDKLGVVGKKFDRILVSAAAQVFPYELGEQLKVNGKLVIPINNSIYEIRKKENGKLEKTEYYGFRFVPLIQT